MTSPLGSKADIEPTSLEALLSANSGQLPDPGLSLYCAMRAVRHSSLIVADTTDLATDLREEGLLLRGSSEPGSASFLVRHGQVGGDFTSGNLHVNCYRDGSQRQPARLRHSNDPVCDRHCSVAMLIAAYSRPFTGEISVKPDLLKQVITSGLKGAGNSH